MQRYWFLQGTEYVLLGAAIRTGVLDFTISEIESIMKQTLPEKFHEMNLRALNYNI